MRSGGDIAFIGGMIKWVLDDMWKQITGVGGNKYTYNTDYISAYTNALYEIVAGFKGPGDAGQDGLFSDYAGGANETDNSKRNYGTKATWAYNDANADKKPDEATGLSTETGLGTPRSVFEILRTHFARYDKTTVCKITGTPEATFEKICETFAATGQKGKAGTIMYAMGTTQHTNGAQMIRSYVILQLLLANIGVSGGGINALRGESNVQGSTDMCLLAHILPGYLKAPLRTNKTLGLDTSKTNGIIYNQDETDTAFIALSAAEQSDAKNSYLWRWTPINNAPAGKSSLNWWQHTPKYMVSLLKAFYGGNATMTNDFGYQWLPKATSWADHYHIALFEAMYNGTIKGLMCWGQNPAVGGPNANMEREALHKLDWLVCVDLWETETANFWQRPGVNPSDIDTEVFLLPAASSYEKEGSVTNSGRWMQWRYKAIDPPGEAKADLWIINKIMAKVIDLYANSTATTDKLPEAIAAVAWNYGDDPDSKEIAKEINGYYHNPHASAGKRVASFSSLLFNGETSSGNWLYCNSYVEEANLDAFEKAHLNQLFPGPDYVGNRATRRWPTDVGNGGYSAADGYKEIGLNSYWAWCWPVNRRVIYNRASVDMNGNPWDSEHPVISWNGTTWLGDVPDGGAAPVNSGGYYPFIMLSEGVARIFGPGLADGPLPEHYEPWESPVDNLMSGQENDPAFRLWDSDHNTRGKVANFPYICSTYRLVEQWLAGQMTRNLPWMVEMQPEVFVEMSEELANEKGISSGEKVIITSARGSMEAVAMVTKRFKPFTINGNTVHQVGIPWHWGYTGLSTGDSANVLTPHVGDANTMIPEYKAFLVNVTKA